ncbi:MAG: hypothetical protein ACOZDD_10300 [Bacteroidota bacterium]
MEYLINYVIQGKAEHRFVADVVDLGVVTPLYSPDPHESEVEKEILHWMQRKQMELNEGESVIVLKTMRV